MSDSITLDLFAPGMTAMHRAGIGGLATVLAQLRPGDIDGLRWDVDDTRVHLHFTEPNALVRLVETSMVCEAGLITFPAFKNRETLEARLYHNERLLDTLLQHNKMLKPDGAKKQNRALEIDGRRWFFAVKQLTDFVHRYGAKKLIDKHGKLARAIEIKGWALPGAVKRHESVAASAIREPCERYLALLFAIVGVVMFRLVSPRDRKKYVAAVIMPEAENLQDFAAARLALAQCSPQQLTVTGLGDAVLIFFAELQAATLQRDRFRDTLRCHAIAMGVVPWAEQQKTRTHILDVAWPDSRTLDCVDAIEHSFPRRYVTRRDGQTFTELPLWRQLFTDNLVQHKPLWAGLGSWLADADKRERMMKYERKQVAGMVQEYVSSLGTEAQIRFVNACHQALRMRYGRLRDRIREEDLDANTLFERENEQIRASLARCRNAATVRTAIIDFWSRGRYNSELQHHWQDMLRFLNTEPWDLVRDLALLALVSYKGSESKTNQDPETTEESP